VPTIRSASPTWPAPEISSATNQAIRASRTATAVAATAGRSTHGTEAPRRQAPAGQKVSPVNPSPAQTMCWTG
jgi:hypothetical protein